MSDRPKRQRKPTQPFQYDNVSAQSTIADAGSTPTRKSPKKSRTTAILDGGTDSSCGGGRGRGRDIGRGRGRGRSSNRHSNTPTRRRQTPTQNSDELAHNIFLSSDPVNDAGAVMKESEDLEYEKQDKKNNKGTVKKIRSKPAIQHRRIPLQGTLLARRRGEEDEVIEQWYADPYERINPNDIAYDQWRLQNLYTLLENRGYNKVNSRQMAGWLMKCNGQFTEYTAPVRKSRAKKPVQMANGNPSTTQHRLVTPSVSIYEDDEEEYVNADEHTMTTQEPKSSQQEPDTAYAAFQASMLPHHRKQKDNATQSEREDLEDMASATAQLSSQTSFGMSGLTIKDLISRKRKHREQSEEQDDSEDPSEILQAKSREVNDRLKLENLKRCLNVFRAVYGSEGPQHTPGEFVHNYFSQNSALPALVPKAGLRTQAHYALQTVALPADNPVFFNDAQRGSLRQRLEARHDQSGNVKLREVFTEDPDFGLTKIRRSERATEADMKLYYAQFARVKAVEAKKSGIINLAKPEAGDEHQYNDDVVRRVTDPALIKIQNEESAKLISEQLQQRLFEWETPSTMLGGIAKQSKDDVLHDGQFALKEHHVWQELRRRQQILDEGGMEAAKLLEEEYEEAQLELKRERRRRENDKIREKRRAKKEAQFAMYDGPDMDVGMRKRVKFSEEIDEEW